MGKYYENILHYQHKSDKFSLNYLSYLRFILFRCKRFSQTNSKNRNIYLMKDLLEIQKKKSLKYFELFSYINLYEEFKIIKEIIFDENQKEILNILKNVPVDINNKIKEDDDFNINDKKEIKDFDNIINIEVNKLLEKVNYETKLDKNEFSVDKNLLNYMNDLFLIFKGKDVILK